MVFMSIFNFLEPSVTIIAQAIPMFRVLVVNVKKNTTAVRITSASQQGSKTSNILLSQQRRWNSRVLGDSHNKEPDEELLHVRVDRTVQVESTLASAGSGSDVVEPDKLYDGSLRQY